MLTDFEYNELVELLFLEEVDFLKAQFMLGLSDDQMRAAIARMEEDGYVKTYAVH